MVEQKKDCEIMNEHQQNNILNYIYWKSNKWYWVLSLSISITQKCHYNFSTMLVNYPSYKKSQLQYFFYKYLNKLSFWSIINAKEQFFTLTEDLTISELLTTRRNAMLPKTIALVYIVQLSVPFSYSLLLFQAFWW